MSELIRVSAENWEWLNSKKKAGDSFNDVVDRLKRVDPDELRGLVEKWRVDSPTVESEEIVVRNKLARELEHALDEMEDQ